MLACSEEVTWWVSYAGLFFLFSRSADATASEDKKFQENIVFGQLGWVQWDSVVQIVDFVASHNADTKRDAIFQK